MDRLVLIIDLDFIEPFGGIHEVVFGDIEREAINGGDVEDVRNCLIVLVIFGGDLPNTFIQQSFV